MLRRGSRGDDVVWLQGLLNVLRRGGDMKLKVDGIFGGNSDARVRQFQGRHGLAVDGIVGPNTFNMLLILEDPYGYGVDVGVYEGPALPPGGAAPANAPNPPLAAPAKPKAAPKTKPSPTSLDQSKVREMLKSNLSPSGWNWLRNQDRFGDLVFVLSRIADVGKIANACGIIDGVLIGARGVALGPLSAMIGGFLFPIGATMSWKKAVTTNERHYGWLAVSYAATHWVFSPTPGQRMTRSKEARERHEWLRDDRDMALLDTAWRTAWDEQTARMNALDLKGHSKAAYRETVRMFYNNSAQEFCRDMKKNIFDEHLDSWKVSETARDNWKSFDKFLYPK